VPIIIKIKEYYNAKLKETSENLSCLLINDIYHALSEDLHVFLLKYTGSRLSGYTLSTYYSALSALTLKDGANYYAVVVTKKKNDVQMFSLLELLKKLSLAKHEHVFLSLSSPEPKCFSEIDLFFCKGCVCFTPKHWDYCIPAYDLPPMLERTYGLKQEDFLFLEKYFRVAEPTAA